MQLEVVKYVKNKYIILSITEHSVEFKTKYNIVHITPDTLILSPEGNDFFELGEPNKQNQYVFVNSMRNYKFVKLHFEITSNNFKHDGEHLDNEKSIATLDMDSARRSKVTVKDNSSKEPQIYRSPISKKDYERLVKILSSCDLDGYPDVNVRMDITNRNSILEIWYNDQKKIFMQISVIPSHPFR